MVGNDVSCLRFFSLRIGFESWALQAIEIAGSFHPKTVMYPSVPRRSSESL